MPPACQKGTLPAVLFALPWGGPLGCLLWRGRSLGPWGPHLPTGGGSLGGLPGSNKCGPRAVYCSNRVSPIVFPGTKECPPHSPLQLLLRLQVRSPWAQPQCRHQPPLASSPWRAATAEKAAFDKNSTHSCCGLIPGKPTPGSKGEITAASGQCPGHGHTWWGGDTSKATFFLSSPLSHEVGTSKVRGRWRLGRVWGVPALLSRMPEWVSSAALLGLQCGIDKSWKPQEFFWGQVGGLVEKGPWGPSGC